MTTRGVFSVTKDDGSTAFARTGFTEGPSCDAGLTVARKAVNFVGERVTVAVDEEYLGEERGYVFVATGIEGVGQVGAT
jgi:hypothetical protein